MTLTELRYIIAVAKEKHFGRAAKRCFVSQSTLSLGIKKLEDEFDIVLFERGHQEVRVTSLGKKIIEQAERALFEVNAIKDIIKTHADPLTEPLKIGAIHTIGPYLFPSILPIVNQLAPQLPLLVEENFTDSLIEKLKRAEIDVAIISLPFDEPGLEVNPLYNEPFVVLVPTSHPLSLSETISLNSLEEETVLLLGPRHCFRDQIIEFCPACVRNLSERFDLQSTLEGSSLETIRLMVANGVGVTIVPRTAACADRYAHRLVSIKHFSGINPSRCVAIAYRKNFSRLNAVKIITQAIRSCGLSGISVINSSDKSFQSDLLSQQLPLVEKSLYS